MDYFRILNLKKEPFSNSPDPELFYPSRNHVECLQRLEMAIRLRRGLNVVLGEVGTGKTTLCRKLIQQISTSAGKEDIELHLVLDPSFSRPIEFLSFIAGDFGLGKPDNAMTDWRLKEEIKNYLFARGVEEGKTVVLLIDEGQKLPDFCLEILREFLNYETNDRKLLQIVIFAQEEFREKINEQDNFADRINLCYSLTPLGYRETCRMVEYRISRTSENGAAKRLFTLPGLVALYKATGGYPRSINMLCHHVVLALIIQNRVKAGWSLVRSCAGRLSLEHRMTMKPRPVFVTAMLLILLLATVLMTDAVSISKWFSAGPAVVRPMKTAVMASVRPGIDNHESIPPSVLGQLSMQNGTNLTRIFNDVFGSPGPDAFKKFVSANPRIVDIDLVQTGEAITFPALPAPLSQRAKVTGRAWVQLARLKTLPEAYYQYKKYSSASHEVMLFPYRNKREGMVFALLIKRPFPDRGAAQAAIAELGVDNIKDVLVLDNWDSDTIFYHWLRDRS
jgi:general secretion pathway protein A